MLLQGCGLLRALQRAPEQLQPKLPARCDDAHRMISFTLAECAHRKHKAFKPTARASAILVTTSCSSCGMNLASPQIMSMHILSISLTHSSPPPHPIPPTHFFHRHLVAPATHSDWPGDGWPLPRCREWWHWDCHKGMWRGICRVISRVRGSHSLLYTPAQ